jgi:DNA-binding response OmpR family regulator
LRRPPGGGGAGPPRPPRGNGAAIARGLAAAGARVIVTDVDLEAARVTLSDAELSLTRREFELLAFLIGHPGRVFTRTELLDRVWGEDFIGTERTVDQHVAQLRARIGPHRIETVRGRGNRLVA